MSRKDTFMGGENQRFPTTIWSEIPRDADPTQPEYRRQLEDLCRAYWKPAYAYIRTAWRKSIEDAKDLTQAFFTHLLQKEHWSRLQPERGSFRGFLKRAIRNFLVDAERKESVRRPTRPLFHLDISGEDLARIGAPPGESPEAAYDREWFSGLMDSSIDELQRRLEGDGKRVYFEVFRGYCLDPLSPESGPKRPTLLGGDPPSAPTYAEIAARAGVKETDVMNYLAHCRNLLWSIIRERVRAYAASEEEVETELKEAARG